MKSLTEVVNALELQVTRVSRQQEELKDQNERLTVANSALEEQLKKQEQQIKELEEKNKVLRIAGASAGDKRDIKLKINELVREVDKCLAQLNK